MYIYCICIFICTAGERGKLIKCLMRVSTIRAQQGCGEVFRMIPMVVWWIQGLCGVSNDCGVGPMVVRVIQWIYYPKIMKWMQWLRDESNDFALDSMVVLWIQ